MAKKQLTVTMMWGGNDLDGDWVVKYKPTRASKKTPADLCVGTVSNPSANAINSYLGDAKDRGHVGLILVKGNEILEVK